MNYQTFLQLLSLMQSFEKKDWVSFTESKSNFDIISRHTGMVLTYTWEYAHEQSVVCLRRMTGMTRQDFSKAYQIPYRTVTDWERGERVPPPYVLDFLAFAVICSIT